MHLIFIVLFALVYQTDGHGQQGHVPNQPHGGQPHVQRKMEEYVHDMKYESSFY